MLVSCGGVGGTRLYLFFTSFLMDPKEIIGLQLFSVFIGCCELPSLYLEVTPLQVVKHNVLGPPSVFHGSPSTGKRMGSANQRLPPYWQLDVWVAVWRWSGKKFAIELSVRAAGVMGWLSWTQFPLHKVHCTSSFLAHYGDLSSCLLLEAALLLTLAASNRALILLKRATNRNTSTDWD